MKLEGDELHGLQHEGPVMLQVIVVSSILKSFREAVRQQIAGVHHEGRMRQRPTHLVQGGLQKPPVRVLAVLAEASQLRSLQYRLPLSRLGGGKLGDERGVGHGIKVNVRNQEEFIVGRLG